MSKRKAFNFYLSYYEVYNQLTTDKDKLSFINALLEKQFKGIEPKGLSSMANFAYVSQREVIERQIKGWEDKTGNKLSYPCQGGLLTPKIGESSTPSVQEKEKEKEKEKVNNKSGNEFPDHSQINLLIPDEKVKKEKKQNINFDKLLKYLNEKTKRTGKEKFRVINKSIQAKYKARLKEGYTNQDIANAIKNAVNDPYHIETNFKYLTPEFFSRADKIDKHGFKSDKKQKDEVKKKIESENPFKEELAELKKLQENQQL